MKAYKIAKPYLIEDLPNSQNVQLLVLFNLGDLRELELERANGADDSTTILSGG